MSYLDTPGIVFAGRFQADVATGNNEVGNFDPGSPLDLAWNPFGSGAFRLLDCSVQDVRTVGPAPDDPVRTARVTDADDRVSAKIVDLDPQLQLASELWGLRVRLVAADGAVLLAGEFAPAAFRDIWFGGGGQARFQSVLDGITWAPEGTSEVLEAMRAESAGGRVSIRLVTFAFNGATRTGSLLGAIGPYRRGEPRQFVAGRRLAAAEPPVFGADLGPTAPAQAATTAGHDRVTVDLAGTLPRNGVTLTDIGSLRLGVLTDPATAEGDPVALGPDVIGLGEEIPYLRQGWLAASGGLVTADVPAAARVTVATRPLALISLEPAPTVLLRETPDGWLVGADAVTRRVETGDEASAAVHVTRYGERRQGVQLDARLAPIEIPPAGPPTGVPESAITIRPLAPTDGDGRTALRVHARDPREPGLPRPRPGLDGQLYQVVVDRDGIGPAAAVVALVFEEFLAPEHPTWSDVRTILAPYARLYPVMTERLMDLSRYAQVVRYRDAIRLALDLDIGDPNSMPVTRDLSRPKRDMILAWLALPDLPGGDDGDDGTEAPPRAAAPAELEGPQAAPDPLSTKRAKEGDR